MKNSRSFFVTVLLLMIPAIMFAGNGMKKSQTAHIKTSAVCDECKARIESAVMELDGVKKAELDLSDKTLTVRYTADKVSLDQIKAAISKAGYDADDVKADAAAYSDLPKCCQGGSCSDSKMSCH